MNRQELIQMLEQELSGERALESAAHLTQFYRSPGASGYHRATDFAADLFRPTNWIRCGWRGIPWTVRRSL